MVNTALGGPFVAPWDVDQLPNDFIDLVRALLYDLPGFVEHRKKVDKDFAEWRAKHPSYKPRRK